MVFVNLRRNVLGAISTLFSFLPGIPDFFKARGLIGSDLRILL
jgi:hypothetical protein